MAFVRQLGIYIGAALVILSPLGPVLGIAACGVVCLVALVEYPAFQKARKRFSDRDTRVIHALEHATLGRLRELGFAVRDGRTDDDGFHFTGTVPVDAVHAAFADATVRLARRERHAATTGRCRESWRSGLIASAIIAGIWTIGLSVAGVELAITGRVSLALLVALPTPSIRVQIQQRLISTQFASVRAGEIRVEDQRYFVPVAVT